MPTFTKFCRGCGLQFDAHWATVRYCSTSCKFWSKVRKTPWRVKQKQTHCPKGHPFNERNTIFKTPQGKPHRRCRICRSEFDKAKYQRRKLLHAMAQTGSAREDDTAA